jgi:hypothetical protein
MVDKKSDVIVTEYLKLLKLVKAYQSIVLPGDSLIHNLQQNYGNESKINKLTQNFEFCKFTTSSIQDLSGLNMGNLKTYFKLRLFETGREITLLLDNELMCINSQP